jgi:hypothetical protein
MAFDVEGLMGLWTDEGVAGSAAEDAFRTFYTDPVTVNGTPLSVKDLAGRAAALRTTYENLRREILDVFEADGRAAVSFRLSGRQTGTLTTSAGNLAPTGRLLRLRVIDLFTLTADGRISSIWMVADELGALAEHDLVRLVGA